MAFKGGGSESPQVDLQTSLDRFGHCSLELRQRLDVSLGWVVWWCVLQLTAFFITALPSTRIVAARPRFHYLRLKGSHGFSRLAGGILHERVPTELHQLGQLRSETVSGQTQSCGLKHASPRRRGTMAKFPAEAARCMAVFPSASRRFMSAERAKGATLCNNWNHSLVARRRTHADTPQLSHARTNINTHTPTHTSKSGAGARRYELYPCGSCTASRRPAHVPGLVSLQDTRHADGGITCLRRHCWPGRPS